MFKKKTKLCAVGRIKKYVENKEWGGLPNCPTKKLVVIEAFAHNVEMIQGIKKGNKCI